MSRPWWSWWQDVSGAVSVQLVQLWEILRSSTGNWAKYNVRLQWFLSRPWICDASSALRSSFSELVCRNASTLGAQLIDEACDQSLMEHEVWWATRESKTIYHGHWQTNHTTLLWRQNSFIKDQWIDIPISGPKVQYITVWFWPVVCWMMRLLWIFAELWPGNLSLWPERQWHPSHQPQLISALNLNNSPSLRRSAYGFKV